MKIQYCSDLHLEFKSNLEFLQENPIIPVGEVLLLAGDIFYLAYPTTMIDKFLDYLSDNFKQVYWIPGNHEYYNSDLKSVEDITINEDLRHNVHLVNNQSVFYNDINIICTTMWTKLNLEHRRTIVRNVADFELIKINGKRLHDETYQDMHEICFNFLNNNLKHCIPEKTIVMTHHVPTLINYPPKFAGSVINSVFAMELDEYIITSNISNWIYGHHHNNVKPFKLGNTNMLTNQLGYVDYSDASGFKNDAIIEI